VTPAIPLRLLTEWQRLPWVARFSILCAVAVAAIVAICWVVFGFGSLGLDPTAMVAAILGITLTVGLGIGLMALVFYSNRSGQDDVASAKLFNQTNEKK
jgi:hypothetical protein